MGFNLHLRRHRRRNGSSSDCSDIATGHIKIAGGAKQQTPRRTQPAARGEDALERACSAVVGQDLTTPEAADIQVAIRSKDKPARVGQAAIRSEHRHKRAGNAVILQHLAVRKAVDE